MIFNPESRALTLAEMTENASYILSYLVGKGWTKNAVCGLLGNMQSESSINPARWEGDNVGDTDHGFGLVQWTPASKYLNWAATANLPYKEMDSNLARILWEVENGAQWITKAAYPISFQEFTVSTESPEYLAYAFITNYERPANPDQPARATQARYWFDTLSGSVTPPDNGGDPGTNPTPTNNDDIYHLWLSNALKW
jgi:hypothetical protein